MIDFHSHVLPGIDDGSTSVEMSIGMLRMEAEQGITHVVATPHFYAQSEQLDSFLQRRDESEQALRRAMEKHTNLPELIVGAEVYFFRGISESDVLHKLTIRENRCLLIELPPPPWDEAVLRELEAIWVKREILPVIAHVERYIGPLNASRVLKHLSQLPVFIQANAQFFTERTSAAAAIRALKAQQIHLLGSDCHNLSSRKPNMGAAVETITKKLGAEALARIAENAERALNYLP